MPVDLPLLSNKIFEIDKSIRGVTFGRLDGEILHFQMRSDIATLNPPGEFGKMDAEVLLPALRSYFEPHTKYFGNVDYILIRFKKVSLAYMKKKNIFLIVSIDPGVETRKILKQVDGMLDENFNGSTSERRG